MADNSPPFMVTGTCRFGAQQLLPLLDALIKETEGVREADDIEYIHRMRVASRRLRAALPLFATCFPGKKFRVWEREVRQITRALGEARDMDVQIAFLEKYKKNSLGTGSRDPVEPLLPRPNDHDVITSLLARLKKQRRNLQEIVKKALTGFEKSHVADDMMATCTAMLPVTGHRRPRLSLTGIPAIAAERINNRVIEMKAFEPWVHNPDAIAEHHALRIAAKKLRYTMEVYAPVYRLNLHKPISRVKKIQEFLGDIHDCDVWIDHVTLEIVKQRTRLHSLTNSQGTAQGPITALKRLLLNRERKRNLLYHRFVRFWDRLGRTGFWGELSHTLITGQKVAFLPHSVLSAEAEHEAVLQLATNTSAEPGHSIHVTDLALQIFDALLPLHAVPTEDRRILEYAGLLHDIGTRSDRKCCRNRTTELIYADEQIPFDLTTRAMTGLTIRLCGKKSADDNAGLSTLLSVEIQKRIHVLASILIIAVNLDSLHQGTVQTVACSISNEEIHMTITAVTDATIEKAQAQSASDPLARILGYAIVIQ